MKRALTIAGSDSGGGAGIQADLKVFAALDVFGTSALTAITAQNTLGIARIESVSPIMVQSQIQAVLSDIGADAVKIGMLHDLETIGAVHAALSEFTIKNLVIDPVMVSSSGQCLLQSSAIRALIEKLFPLAELITPNLPEAEVLLGRNISSLVEWEAAALELLNFGSRAVLLKGGHAPQTWAEDCRDLLVVQGELHWLTTPRVRTRNAHGTGCTLSAAIVAFLARGLSLETSIVRAKAFLTESLERGLQLSLGKGHGPALF